MCLIDSVVMEPGISSSIATGSHKNKRSKVVKVIDQNVIDHMIKLHAENIDTYRQHRNIVSQAQVQL